MKDYRYFYKRAFFLAVLAEGLRSSDLPIDVKFTYHGGNQRKPIILLEPTPGQWKFYDHKTAGLRPHLGQEGLDFSSLRCVIRVIPTFSSSTLPTWPSRLHPHRCNLRISSSNLANGVPTPVYNSDIAKDASPVPTLSYLDQLSSNSPQYAKAVILLKIWANQRAFPKLVGFSNIGFLLAIMLAYLIGGNGQVRRTLPTGSTSWQLFQGCLEFIGNSKYSPMDLCANWTFLIQRKPI